VPDFLAEKSDEITTRLNELKPQVEEYRRLEAAVAALAGIDGAGSAAPKSPNGRRRGSRRGPGRPRGSAGKAKDTISAKKAGSGAAPATKATRASRRAGRRKGSGQRAAEALSHVIAQPGITIPELAARMGIKQNYLYRVLPGLEGEGKVEKQGRTWHPTKAALAA
jgi:hypothetical protein